MNRLLRTLHWINIDTAAGAVVTSLFVAQCMGSTIPWVASLTLFLAVLAIYNFDHLMDARRVTTTARSARLRFYQQNLKALSIYQLILMVGLITIIWYLPVDILRAGLVLALVTGIYFILLFFVFPNKFLLKEIMIATVYTLALFLAPVYTNPSPGPDNYWLILLLEILLLAIANTLIFAWYDCEIDVREGHTSLAGNLAFKLHFSPPVLQQVIILLMALTLSLCLVASRSLRKNERYRIVGDAVFFLPIISLLK